MPKLTVFEKKETGNQRETINPTNASSLLIQEQDLLEINLFDQEKPTSETGEQSLNRILAQKKFNEYLIQAVDEALISLGEPVKNTIYFQLENNFNIQKNEIPDKIVEFIDILHKIFGLGASRLEIKFMKNLHSKVQVSIEIKGCDWPLSNWIIEDMSFTEYVQKTREKYCNCEKNTALLPKQIGN